MAPFFVWKGVVLSRRGREGGTLFGHLVSFMKGGGGNTKKRLGCEKDLILLRHERWEP